MSVVMSLLLALPVWAAPYLACDPQGGVDSYQLEFDTDGDGAYEMTIPIEAQADGSLLYDLDLWLYGTGWFEGRAAAGVDYEVVDQNTQVSTTVTRWSNYSNFRMRIPNARSAPSSYHVRQDAP